MGELPKYLQQVGCDFGVPEVSQDTYKEVGVHIQGEGEAEELADREHHDREKLRPVRPTEGSAGEGLLTSPLPACSPPTTRLPPPAPLPKLSSESL